MKIERVLGFTSAVFFCRFLKSCHYLSPGVRHKVRVSTKNYRLQKRNQRSFFPRRNKRRETSFLPGEANLVGFAGVGDPPLLEPLASCIYDRDCVLCVADTLRGRHGTL